jgi:hypothetical protein
VPPPLCGLFVPLSPPFSLQSPHTPVVAATLGHHNRPCCQPLLRRASPLRSSPPISSSLLLSSLWRPPCRAPWRSYGAPELELPLPATASLPSLLLLLSPIAPIPPPLLLRRTMTTIFLPHLLLPL